MLIPPPKASVVPRNKVATAPVKPKAPVRAPIAEPEENEAPEEEIVERDGAPAVKSHWRKLAPEVPYSLLEHVHHRSWGT